MDDSQPAFADMSAHRIARLLEMRRVIIRFMVIVEDELVAAEALRPAERACVTREMRRANYASEENMAATAE